MSFRPTIVAGALLTTGLALAATPTAHAATTTVERGIVVECTTEIGGQPAYVSLYENNRYANVVQVNIGEEGASRQPADIARAGRVRTGVTVAGSRARVTGTVAVTGPATRVHEEQDDAGQHLVMDGTHRALTTRLTLSYRGEQAPLTCETAFRYRLRVTRTPSV